MCNALGLRPKTQFLVLFGGEAVKQYQKKIFEGGKATLEPPPEVTLHIPDASSHNA